MRQTVLLVSSSLSQYYKSTIGNILFVGLFSNFAFGVIDINCVLSSYEKSIFVCVIIIWKHVVCLLTLWTFSHHKEPLFVLLCHWKRRIWESMEGWEEKDKGNVCHEGNEQSKNHFKAVSQVSHERKDDSSWLEVSVSSFIKQKKLFSNRLYTLLKLHTVMITLLLC